jgi:hypothetical protein
VLIVVFNENRFLPNNLPFIETMYRPIFRWAKWLDFGMCNGALKIIHVCIKHVIRRLSMVQGTGAYLIFSLEPKDSNDP